MEANSVAQTYHNNATQAQANGHWVPSIYGSDGFQGDKTAQAISSLAERKIEDLRENPAQINPQDNSTSTTVIYYAQTGRPLSNFHKPMVLSHSRVKAWNAAICVTATSIACGIVTFIIKNSMP